MKRRRVLTLLIWLSGSLVFIILILISIVIIFNSYAGIISKGIPIQAYNEPRSALLVIDIQEATTGEYSEYPYYRENSDNLIEITNLVAENFRNHKQPVILVRSVISNPLINLINDTYAKGQPGVNFDRRLSISSDYELEKSVSDAFRNTTLDSILIKNKVNHLYIAGLDAAECINATADAAKNRNYIISIIEDAVISRSEKLTDSMMIRFRNRGIEIIKSDRIIFGE